jgi:hypothetical protein
LPPGHINATRQKTRAQASGQQAAVAGQVIDGVFHGDEFTHQKAGKGMSEIARLYR